MKSYDPKADQYYSLLSSCGKKTYIFLSLINLICIVIVIISISINFENNELEKTNLAHECTFLFFGVLTVIYGIYCGIKGKYLNEMFTLFTLIALLGSGAIIFYSIEFINTKISFFIPALIFSITVISLIIFKERTTLHELQQSPSLFNKYLAISSTISLIGTISILAGTINFMQSNQDLGTQFTYEFDNYLFILFGFIVAFYGIYCGMREISLNFAYFIFLALSLVFLGPILFFAGYNIQNCNLQQNTSCASIYIQFIGSLIYIISALIIIAIKHFYG